MSEPFLQDDNFGRSVVYLTDHDDEAGTMGFIVNQATNIKLHDLFPDAGTINHTIYHGGPVGSNQLFFLHRAYNLVQSGVHIASDVYLGADLETIQFLVLNDLIPEDRVKFFLGYSGWEQGQLSNEIENNTWLVSPAYASDIIFQTNTEAIWKEAVIGMGPKIAHIARFPNNPNLN